MNRLEFNGLQIKSLKEFLKDMPDHKMVFIKLSREQKKRMRKEYKTTVDWTAHIDICVDEDGNVKMMAHHDSDD